MPKLGATEQVVWASTNLNYVDKKGVSVNMCLGDRFNLIDTSDKNLWKVKRPGESDTFYVPSYCLKGDPGNLISSSKSESTKPITSLAPNLSHSADDLVEDRPRSARSRHGSECTESSCCTPDWKDGAASSNSGADDLSLSGCDIVESGSMKSAGSSDIKSAGSNDFKSGGSSDVKSGGSSDVRKHIAALEASGGIIGSNVDGSGRKVPNAGFRDRDQLASSTSTSQTSSSGVLHSRGHSQDSLTDPNLPSPSSPPTLLSTFSNTSANSTNLSRKPPITSFDAADIVLRGQKMAKTLPPSNFDQANSQPKSGSIKAPNDLYSSNHTPKAPPKVPPNKPQLAVDPVHESSSDDTGTESEESESESCSSTEEEDKMLNKGNAVPSEWDIQLQKDGTEIYIHKETKERWTKAHDAAGQQYFYNDNRKSVWGLEGLTSPDKEIDIDIEPESPDVYGANSLPGTLDSRSSPFFVGAGESLMRASKRDTKKISKDQITGPVDFKLHRSEKRGMLNKTKYSENGRLLPKKWLQCYVVLTGPTLIFYKDPKAAAPKSNLPNGKPDLTLSLENLDVSIPDPSISKRKYIMKLDDRGAPGSSVVYLLEAVNPTDLEGWKTSLKYAKDWLMEERYAQESQQPLIEDKKKTKSIKRGTTINSADSFEDHQTVKLRLTKFFRNRLTKEDLEKKGIIKNEPVFGSTIELICEYEHSKVPKFVLKCIEAIESRDLGTVGIYRVSGNGATIQKLRLTVDQSDNYDLTADKWDFEVISDALKLFFRELKQPLIPFQFYDQLTSTIVPLSKPTTESDKSKEEKVAKVKKIIHKFPEVNYRTCQALFHHLHRVVEHSSQNQMQASNLAIVFGPNLLWPEVDSDNITSSFMRHSRVVEYLLTECHTIFGPPPSSQHNNSTNHRTLSR